MRAPLPQPLLMPIPCAVLGEEAQHRLDARWRCERKLSTTQILIFVAIGPDEVYRGGFITTMYLVLYYPYPYRQTDRES